MGDAKCPTRVCPCACRADHAESALNVQDAADSGKSLRPPRAVLAAYCSRSSWTQRAHSRTKLLVGSVVMRCTLARARGVIGVVAACPAVAIWDTKLPMHKDVAESGQVHGNRNRTTVPHFARLKRNCSNLSCRNAGYPAPRTKPRRTRRIRSITGRFPSSTLASRGGGKAVETGAYD